MENGMEMGLLEFIQKDFWHAAPILAAGVFASIVIIERTRALYSAYPIDNEKGFFDRMRDLVVNGKVAEAVALCERFANKPVAQVVKTGLLRAHQTESLIQNGLELAVDEQVQKIQKRTSFLAMLANVATLLGLLGTIMGLVTSFQSLADVDAAERSAKLALGISTAMNATILGLAVAILSMISFSFLMNKTNELVSSVEAASVKTLDIIKQRYFEAETRANATGTFGGTNHFDPRGMV